MTLRRRIVLRDSCMTQTWKYEDTGTVHTRGKRRPDEYKDSPEVCSWHRNVRCPDHPNKR